MSTLNMSLNRLFAAGSRRPRQLVISVVLLVALVAFEIFNFDTTQFALRNLLGPVAFLGLQWATILAIAFCGIDLAGLVRLFTPQRGRDEPKEVWYLTGAWLLGATMNAVMTWWAVSLTLLNHDFGNEVLSRAQLLRYVPIFVAVLVWLTRILFIGSLTMAGEQILFAGDGASAAPPQPRPGAGRGAAASRSNGLPSQPPKRNAAGANPAGSSAPMRTAPPAPARVEEPAAAPLRPKPAPAPASSNNRVRQRPPLPGARPGSVNASPQARAGMSSTATKITTIVCGGAPLKPTRSKNSGGAVRGVSTCW